MKGTISPGLLEPLDRGVYGLTGSGESACGQRLDMLGVVDLGVRVDHFLLGFEELLGELSELMDFPFNEWVAQSSHCMVDEWLIWLPIFEEALSKR